MNSQNTFKALTERQPTILKAVSEPYKMCVKLNNNYTKNCTQGGREKLPFQRASRNNVTADFVRLF